MMPGEWQGWRSPAYSRAWGSGDPWPVSHCQPSPAFSGLGWVQGGEMSTWGWLRGRLYGRPVQPRSAAGRGFRHRTQSGRP